MGPFTVVVEPPFVVLGDDLPETVKGHATRVVRWAVDRLKRDFFAQEPERILDVWLFKDGASYESNAPSRSSGKSRRRPTAIARPSMERS